MHLFSIQKLAEGLKQKQFSSVELTEHFLKRIKAQRNLNAFINVDEQGALHSARQADKTISMGKASALTGIPMAHKDIFCTRDLPTSCASRMLSNYVSPFDATVVEKLKQQGCVVVGKTNMDEFAMGSGNENSWYGPVKNPWHQQHVPGGSSGGSAAAVAASLIPYATGSDTGGSIRQPAAFCGISGIKPTYGLVSRYGMVAYASSLDQAGPMARSAADLAILLEAMAGFDPKDSTSVDRPVDNYSDQIDRPLSSLKIGLPRCFFTAEVDKAVQQIMLEAIKVYEQAGAETIELDLKLEHLWVPCYYVIACAEASSNLSRYDGIRFGHRSARSNSLKEMIINSRHEGFGEEVKRRILTGTHVLSAGYFEAYYLQALKIRRLIQCELKQAFESVDVILGPTAPTAAFKLGEKIDPIENYLSDVFTVSANLAGIPAISFPAGLHQGLPVGMQLLGPHFSEARLLNIAHQYQQLTHWHQASPTE